MTTPAPRREIVEALEQLIRDYVETGARSAVWEDRAQWSTLGERATAIARVGGRLRCELASARAAADQQDAELAPPINDEEWLRDTGIMP